jgi:inward rectifier potassium channel
VKRGGRPTPRPIIRGQDSGRWTDFYQAILRAPWWAFLGGMATVFFSVNIIFAFLYYLDPGGIAALKPNDFWEAFFFSAITFTTSATGPMVPVDLYCNIVVTVEGFFGIMNIAVATGVLFARISRPTSRMMFSKVATITLFDGMPTLMLRVANQRGNQVLEAEVTVTLARQVMTREGHAMRRFEELPLARARTPLFALSWTIMHPIGENSPLANATYEAMLEQQMEILVVVSGVDETYSDKIYARHSYMPDEIVWNKRFVDILSTRHGRRHVDLARFHDVCDAECIDAMDGVVSGENEEDA